MKKEKIKQNVKPVGVGVHDAPYFKKSKGITLIALIITIIVMLILVGVTVSVSLNGGLFGISKESARQTEIEAEKEQLFSAAIGAVKNNGEVNFEELNSTLPEGFEAQKVGNNQEVNGEEVQGGIYKTETGNIYSVSSNGSVEYVPTLKELRENHEFEYYSTLSGAISDVNTGEIGENADSNKEEATAGIYIDNGKINVVLLKDTTETEKIQPNKDVTINLGGNTLTFNNTSLGIDGTVDHTDTITIDGRLSGSTIILNGVGRGARVFQTRANTFIINGGSYFANFTDELTEDSTGVIVAHNSTGGKLIMTNCHIEASSASTASPEHYLSVYGVGCYSEAEITNCNIKGNANYCVENGKYTSLSIGVDNGADGTLTLKNCNVMGTQAGVESSGNIYIDGGIYESYAHGGVYFGTGTKDAYACNATIRECEMPEGYTTLNCPPGYAGFYIGGSSQGNYITVYMDNCKLYGSLKAIALRSSSGEHGNTLYISNSTVIGADGVANGKCDVRIDNADPAHKVYMGRGCNFTVGDVTGAKSSFIVTNEVYSR